jgi:hypothetical protein
MAAAAAALGVGSITGIGFATAGPASAASPCSDEAIAQPTPVHATPNDQSATIKFKNYGDIVAGPCNYWSHNDPDGQHWYMQVVLSGGGYGYIWVQRLYYGEFHECDHDGSIQSIGSGNCPLFNT